MNIFNQRHSAALALDSGTGTATREGESIDLRGFQGCCVALHINPTGTATTAKLQGSVDGMTWSDLADTTLAFTALQKVEPVHLLDLQHPPTRYVRLVVTKDGSNASTESAIAYRYRAIDEPVSQHTTAKGHTLHAPQAAA